MLELANRRGKQSVEAQTELEEEDVLDVEVEVEAEVGVVVEVDVDVEPALELKAERNTGLDTGEWNFVRLGGFLRRLTRLVPLAEQEVSPEIMLSMICSCILSPSDSDPVPLSSKDDSRRPSQSTAEWPVIDTQPTLTCTICPSL